MARARARRAGIGSGLRRWRSTGADRDGRDRRTGGIRSMRAKSGVQPGTVVFVNSESWHCFDQLAAVLGRRGIRTVRVLATDLRRGRIDRLADRWVYAETVDLHHPRGTDRLGEILTAER